ncbi:MAG: ABC transporter ATP-binding protein [Candidatus Hydrogenedentes bacterium]|nr:ABC transporter ATP-binding protein [Candidatus Hydrogenedentota bacterium]
MMFAIDVQSVVKRYGARTVLDGFSCSINGGECIALYGPSGSGKTTLLRIIAGLEPPDAGNILFHECETGNGPAVATLDDGVIGYMPQEYALWPHLRAARHVEFVLKNRGLTQQERRQRANDLLQITGLVSVAQAYPAELSGGEQQRLAFARAVATNPRVLLLDEPFSNLDNGSRTLLTDELLRRKESENVTIVIATHDAGETFAVADRRIDLMP